MNDDPPIRSDEARRRFRQLLNRVEHDGAHVTILRYDTPAAVVVPVDWHRAAMDALSGTREGCTDEAAGAS